MSKPTDLADWDTNATNTIAPTSGHISDGYVNNETPTAAEFNEWMRRVGLWVRYVDSNQIDGDLEVTGDLTVDGAAHGTAGLPLAVDSGLAVTGGDISVDGSLYYTSPLTRLIGTSEARVDVEAHTISHAQIILAASTEPIYIPLPVCDGDRLTGWRIRAQKNTGSGDELALTLLQLTNGAETPLGDAASNADASPGNVSIGVTGQVIDVAAGSAYYLRIEPSGSVSPSADRVWSIEIDVCHPAP